jgi:hypothetical protein
MCSECYVQLIKPRECPVCKQGIASLGWPENIRERQIYRVVWPKLHSLVITRWIFFKSQDSKNI